MKPQKQLSPLCGNDTILSPAPFPFDQDLYICDECHEKVYHTAGCDHYETCYDCPYFQDRGDGFCHRDSFDLTEIGYDPHVVYLRPKQLALL